ncbi:MAG: zinc-ribbon domain-containing protein, partial [Acidaminococcaceae bacterium]|nr:zinc-ribbon domain-containing protein [Acidaminococcaceae bacterium]
MAKFCRFCGKPVKENSKFCENCGKSLAKASAAPVPPVCPRCGEPLAPDVVFCGNCGLNLQQGTGYASAVPEPTVSENWQQDWNPAQNQQQGWAPQQPQGREYPQQQGWAQPQPQPGPNVRESVQAKRQGRSVSSLLEGFGSSKMLMAAAAAVILLVVGITGFWKPGFLRSSSSKLENGMLALNDIALDFKQTNLKNGAATLATVKDTEEEVQSGLIGNLYVIDVDKNCQGKVTITIPVPKDFKPTTGNGRYIKLGIGR